MEINGYGYVDFTTTRNQFGLPCFLTKIDEGEFILNLYNGKKQHFKPIEFDIRVPAEHTVNGKRYDMEIHILHHYKGTDK